MSFSVAVVARLLLSVAIALAAGGCASIIDGTTQTVAVETYIDGRAAPADCKLSNSRGVWYVTPPGATKVQRAYGDLTVDCTAKGSSAVSQSVPSSTKALVFGNILLGGLLGAGIDIANGAAYDYPSPIRVTFTDVVTPVKPKIAAALAGNRPSTAPALDAANCAPLKPPSEFRSGSGRHYYEAFCADGRLLHLACGDSACRLRTSEDR